MRILTMSCQINYENIWDDLHFLSKPQILKRNLTLTMFLKVFQKMSYDFIPWMELCEYSSIRITQNVRDFHVCATYL